MFFSHFKNCCTEHPTTDGPDGRSSDGSAAAATWHNISTAPNILMSKRKTTTCCFCSLQLKRKNLQMHIQRHHSSKTSDITANRHLKSHFQDLCTVFMSKNLTWVSPVSWKRATGHMTMQEKWASRSLTYSPLATNSPIVHDEGILTDMVVNKWFSKNTESECLRRKLAADTEGAPLSVEVYLGQEQGHIYFSVLESHISSYSRLGRVMVHYDDNKSTWHCPCTKPRKSCPHTSIAKWHLQQSRPDFFKKMQSCHEDSSQHFHLRQHLW
ncbi:hypothetical protein F7725_000094 [Dissostichus mawsoni]|uniref:Uncharacterized protein n=1 Tax=Dissostichus mawsoni TaxID=36200 RepID=A0A7J5ZFR1_DISMA|nr:hypothetical protein F7725_000094 [Dissostichus mawsoni]